eukprot:gb/GEZN01002509.1/.p1 GENE.gb/GEZN01002509.1/~~gb/GEZN01002509.1/.p1  ORF type:complete len:710 (+),score=149.07 gb/GEZN01002509.1/:95-2131(+)
MSKAEKAEVSDSDSSSDDEGEEKRQNWAIGIDLGTTYSCVGVFRKGKVEIIANDQGNRTTPSYVAFTDTERIVGDGAKSQAPQNPARTIFDAKRLIGRQFKDTVVQADMELWPFKVVEANDGSGRPKIEVEWKGQKLQFFPEEISAVVLDYLKKTAEAYLGSEVKDAVITCPAYFNDGQRQATKNAGTVAGLNVLRIINEPTAAAIAYGLERGSEDKEKRVLVYDLGGGTFDVTLLSIDDGIFEVKATAGDTHLGGEDFDSTMIDHVLKAFTRQHRVKIDPATNSKAIRRLRTACERAKRALSSSLDTTIEIESLYEGIDFQYRLTRARFEDMCMHFFKACMDPIEQVLKDAKITKDRVDDVVLVGGSTRIPKVQQMIEEYFGKPPNKTINPDEAVAYGAAVQAGILTGVTSDLTEDFVLIDVAPLSLGVEAAGGMMSVIIPRNSTIPAVAKKMYSTNADNQTGVDICVYEGERIKVEDNTLLAKFELEGIPPAGAGVPRIEVSFTLDASGILNVGAVEKSSGQERKITINSDQIRLGKDEIDKMVKEAEKFANEDAHQLEKIQAKNELETMCREMRAFIENKSNKINLKDYENINNQLVNITSWIVHTPKAKLKEYKDNMEWIQNELEPIIAEILSGKRLSAHNMAATFKSLKRKETLLLEAGEAFTAKRLKMHAEP